MIADVNGALAADLLVLAACAAALFRYGRISALHPAATYLFFHVYVVTLRLFAVSSGVESLMLFTDVLGHEEITRAAVAADMALVAMTAAWLWVASTDYARHGPTDAAGVERGLVLSPRHLWCVVAVILPVGVLGLLNFGYAADPASNFGEWGSSYYLTGTVSWPCLAVLMLVYYYGLRTPLVLAAAALMFLMILNSARYVFVVSVIFMCFAYLSHSGRKWFPPRAWAALAAAAILWFPLKQVEWGIRSGIDPQTIAAEAYDYSMLGITETNVDLAFLDQAAGIMTLVDERGDYFYGKTWLPLLILPVPRPLWPDKPRQNEYVFEISTPGRSVGTMGMVSTLVGDAYVNFGYVGVVVIPFLVAYGYARGYFAAMRRPHRTVARFAYIVFAANLLQVYRDGLMSIVTFSLVNSMPMMVLILLHWLLPRNGTGLNSVEPASQ